MEAKRKECRPNYQQQIPKKKLSERCKISDVAAVPGDSIVKEMMRCCSTCEKIPPPTSFTCGDGHLTCFDCADQQDEPGTCKFATSGYAICGKRMANNVPCFIYKTLYQKSAITCPGDQCRRVIKGNEIHLHELTCSGIKKLECYFGDCPAGTLFTMRPLVDHLLEDHQIQYYRNCMGMIVHPWEEWPLNGGKATHIPFVLETEGVRFVCVCNRKEIDGVPFPMILIGLYHDAEADGDGKEPRILATIELLGENKNSRTWTGILPKIGTGLDQVLVNCWCLNIPDIGHASAAGYIRITIHGDKDSNPFDGGENNVLQMEMKSSATEDLRETLTRTHLLD